MGGDCLNVGLPSKAVIRTARVAAAVRDSSEFGVEVPDGVRIDFGQAMERMRRLRASIAPHDSVERFKDMGIDVFIGEGRFVDTHTVEVAGERLSFKKAVIATGARAVAPPINGLDTVNYLTNETVFSLTELPKQLAVIGAGPIGCEMAQAFARFGSEVLLVEATHGILPREDTDASGIVLESMLKDG
jgi:pyruvate/2-oxoglutarate dehydrogenase complex dihydrolipoamide dehydrogenase (E3) component